MRSCVGMRVLLAWTMGVGSSFATEPIRAVQEGAWLARVDTRGLLDSFPLPVFSQGQDAVGQEYVLVKATAAKLDQLGRAYQALDVGAESATYILAHEFRSGARAAAQGRFHVVHDDGRRLIIRAASGDEMDALAALGFQCRFLPSTPLVFAPAPAPSRLGVRRTAAVASNAAVSAMMAQVTQTNLEENLR